jgi:Transposase, Mutator family
LGEKAYPYLYLDATYLKVRWASRVTSMALLVCVGVEEEGYREVLAVEVAGSQKGAAYASLLRGLLERGLHGVRLVVSDDHEGIKAAVAGELPGVERQRCVVHFERNVLSQVPSSSMAEVAEDLKVVFKVRREDSLARALAKESSELYGERFPKAVSLFERGIEDALTYLSFPASHHARLRTTNVLERLFKEDEGGGGLPRRDEREHASYGDRLEKQRRVGAKALPHHGRPRSGRETQPTTFETLTNKAFETLELVQEALGQALLPYSGRIVLASDGSLVSPGGWRLSMRYDINNPDRYDIETCLVDLESIRTYYEIDRWTSGSPSGRIPWARRRMPRSAGRRVPSAQRSAGGRWSRGSGRLAIGE